jgi:predicted transcriptional regulator
MLRKKGKDPFDYPVKLAKRVSKFLSDEIEEALDKADKTNRPQKQQIEGALRAGAEELSEGAKKNIERGGLGRNTGKYAKRKKALIRRGYGVSKYGDNTIGVFTGRFLKCINHRWRKGHRPT